MLNYNIMNYLTNTFDYCLEKTYGYINNYLPDSIILKNHKELLDIYEGENLRDYIEKYSKNVNKIPSEIFERLQLYKLYLYSFLPNNIYLKLFRDTNNFYSWTTDDFNDFTHLIDLYANDKLKNNYHDNIIILSFHIKEMDLILSYEKYKYLLEHIFAINHKKLKGLLSQ